MLIYRKKRDIERLGLVNGGLGIIEEKGYWFKAESKEEEKQINDCAEKAEGVGIYAGGDPFLMKFVTENRKQNGWLETLIEDVLTDEKAREEMKEWRIKSK